MHAYLVVALKGAAMGVAEIIPGVSGGTIALVVGIYDRLVAAIAGLRPAPLRHLPYLHRRDNRRAFVDEFVEMDLPFLIALGLGMATMLILLARVVEGILATYPGITYAFFAGLILASAIVLYQYVSVDTPGRIGLSLLVIATAFVLSGLASTTMGHSMPVIFVAGAIAITAMVLPGVSGSFLLVALGQYEYMIAALNDFISGIGALVSDRSSDALIEAAPPVFVFLMGATIGVLSVAHAVSYALERARELTLIVLISLMVGALRVPGEEVLDAWDPSPTWIGAVLLAAIVGAGAILVFDRLTGDLAY